MNTEKGVESSGHPCLRPGPGARNPEKGVERGIRARTEPRQGLDQNPEKGVESLWA